MGGEFAAALSGEAVDLEAVDLGGEFAAALSGEAVDFDAFIESQKRNCFCDSRVTARRSGRF